MLMFLPATDEHQGQIAILRAGLVACKDRQARAIMAYRADRALYGLLEIAVQDWVDSTRPDIRPVLDALALVRAFHAMLRDLPAPRPGRKALDADQGMARGRRGPRRRGGRR